MHHIRRDHRRTSDVCGHVQLVVCLIVDAMRRFQRQQVLLDRATTHDSALLPSIAASAVVLYDESTVRDPSL
jgi:hypothetical protein